MTEDRYKAEIDVWMRFCDPEIPNILTNMPFFRYKITPELKEWHDKLLFPEVIKRGVRKWAYVVSPEVFSQLQEKHILNKGNTTKAGLEEKYFEDSNKAREWIATSD